MPDEKLKDNKTQDLPPDEIDDNKNEEGATGAKKGFLFSMLEIFKHLFPAFKEAFAAGTKTFKRRVRGITEPEPEPESEQHLQEDTDPSFEEIQKQELLAKQQAGGFKSKLTAFKQTISILNPFRKPVTSIPAPAKDGESGESGTTETAAGSKKRKFVIAFSIVLIIIIPTCIGLYLGGMFDEDAATGKNGKSISTAPQENSRKKGLFDAIFGKKSQKPATPQEKLAAMNITYNPNNFVKYAGQNDIPVVKLFIQSGMSPDTRRLIDGFTPLTAAASFDRMEMARFLLDVNGADINAQDNDGQTPLMKAVRHNRPHMAELLLERKADYNIADKNGNTALSMASEYPGDNPLTKAFKKFGVNIASTQKEPAKNAEKSEPPALPAPPTADSAAAAPAKPKSTKYQEVSVTEFLKFIETMDNK